MAEHIYGQTFLNVTFFLVYQFVFYMLWETFEFVSNGVKMGGLLLRAYNRIRGLLSRDLSVTVCEKEGARDH